VLTKIVFITESESFLQSYPGSHIQ